MKNSAVKWSTLAADEPAGLDRLLSSVEGIGHLLREKQIDLYVVVPVGRTYGFGDMALDQERTLQDGQSLPFFFDLLSS